MALTGEPRRGQPAPGQHAGFSCQLWWPPASAPRLPCPWPAVPAGRLLRAPTNWRGCPQPPWEGPGCTPFPAAGPGCTHLSPDHPPEWPSALGALPNRV